MAAYSAVRLLCDLGIALLLAPSIACSPRPRAGESPPANGSAHSASAASACAARVPDDGTHPGVSEIIHGVRVDDPFRWLEDGASADVRAWVDRQTAATRTILGALPVRSAVLDELERSRPQRGWQHMPAKRGEIYFYQRRDPSHERGAILTYDSNAAHESVLIDLDSLEPVIKHWSLSRDGARIVALMSRNGSDALTARVFDVRARRWFNEEVTGLRYSYPYWEPTGTGFYYTWSPTDPKLAAEQRAAQSEIRFHLVDTDPARDTRARAATGIDGTFEIPSVSADGRWLLASRISGQPERTIYMTDRRRENGPWKALTPPDSHALYDHTFANDALLVITDEGAPRGRVFRVDLARPERANWQEIVSERKDAKLDDVTVIGDVLGCEYRVDGETVYELRKKDGSFIKKLQPPSNGSLMSLAGAFNDAEGFVAFATYTEPYEVYAFKPPDYALTPFPRGLVAASASTETYVTEKVFYTSRDGTRAPIFVVRARSTAAHKPAPLMLSGYGTFGDDVSPRYIRGLATWLNRGGIYAEAIVRGGGEYGAEWHKAGMGVNRKNVYDDFIAASEHLVRDGWTSPDRFVLRGTSSGGLLVAVAEVERPELYRAVIADLPLTDMVRFTSAKDNGTLWVGEYGSPAVPNEFAVLYRYSPYHRVRDGIKYPWTLVLGADSDERVDPMHGRKFVAALQKADPCSRTLLRVEHDAGHAGATRESERLKEEADVYAFALAACGLSAP